MRAVIRTFPPTANPNYGGILQAWALQRFLRELDVDAVVDASRAPRPEQRSVRARAHAVARGAALRMVPTRAMPARLLPFKVAPAVDAPLLEFASHAIPTTHLLDAHGRPKARAIEDFDVFIVGSDQVWRPSMMNIEANLFDFLGADDPRPRLSYAASFGTDALDLPRARLERTRELAQRFAGVSVREAGAVEMVRRLWGVRAEAHVDPTLLLSRQAYRALAEETEPTSGRGRLVAYVLDEGEAARSITAQISRHLGEPALSLLPPATLSPRSYLADADAYRKPTIPQWLASIDAARFVVTDSFHGTVFSIIANVPFLTILNQRRGGARLESLLDTFGLRDRLVRPGERVSADLVARPTDWNLVNGRIDRERERSRDYLRRTLGLHGRRHDGDRS